MKKIYHLPESVTIIGAGNVAWQIAHTLNKAHVKIEKILNRSIEKAKELAIEVNADFSGDFKLPNNNRQYVVLAVSDSSLPEIINRINAENHILIHTSGSISMEVFKGKAAFFGVLYPFQTLTKNVKTDFANVSVFTEASDDDTHMAIDRLALKISNHVHRIDSDHRRKLHLAGVIANNFTNHLAALAFDYLDKNGIDKSLLIPLLQETLNKIKEIGPYESQTGPARRNNNEVINKHLEMLKDDPRLKNLYKAISDSIIAYYSK